MKPSMSIRLIGIALLGFGLSKVFSVISIVTTHGAGALPISVGLLICLIWVILGVGLLMGQKWSKKGTVILSAIGVIK